MKKSRTCLYSFLLLWFTRCCDNCSLFTAAGRKKSREYPPTIIGYRRNNKNNNKKKKIITEVWKSFYLLLKVSNVCNVFIGLDSNKYLPSHTIIIIMFKWVLHTHLYEFKLIHVLWFVWLVIYLLSLDMANWQ